MSRKASPTLVGAFVLGAVVLALGGIILLGSKDLFRETYPMVAYFQSSVNGLRDGAPVKFKGVEIGSVDEIRLPLANGPEDSPIAVFFSLDSAKLRSSRQERLDAEDLERAIAEGLRARLEQESFVTGLLYVSIVHAPDSEANLRDPIEGIPEIPTIPSEFEEITAQIRGFVKRLEGVDLEALVDDLQGAARSLREVLDAGEVRELLAELDRTLVVIGEAAEGIRQEVGPLGESLRAAADNSVEVGDALAEAGARASRTLVSVEELARSVERSVQELGGSLEATLLQTRSLIDPSAPPLVRLDQTLAELGAAARAARALLETLERDPAALVRGKGSQEEQR